ncbi:2-phospho-L-lactate transferase [Thermoflexus sp.]|jgi:LPPG:FO 2-phospho-L-lactate transferase|uniref:2-phospho-L-lactate transferase n=1 Tax=Thermoflexus sp. TaxID=1969742 RepID=UPI002615B362|nr:2-phospho-L-lactate transferase [Thermoflexus sp.]
MRLVVLSGGVGGARMADGFARILPPESLAVVVNTGDDFEWHGLRVCPDLDTVMYTLAGIANPETGWGIAGDTWGALEMLGRYGGETWFRVGDRDLATHVYRTFLLGQGLRLSEVTARLCRALGVRVAVWPMSDEPVRTIVDTEEGPLPFQEYFVRRGCQPRVRGFRWEGLERARLAPEARAALEQADLVVIAPSNPYVSIGPILALPGVSELLKERTVVAVSPILGGRALKGPAAKMMAELGEAPSALAVARRYQAFLDGFVLDRTDAALAPAVAAMGIRPLVTGILILDPAARLRLAEEILQWVASWA